MKILLTGGAGFIGSNITDAYIQAGHKVFVIDDESSGKKSQVNTKAGYKKLNIQDRKGLGRIFSRHKFDVVNHHAAQIDVRKSVADPLFDAKVNINGLLNILEQCRLHRVKKIIFSSSGGTVYGECPRPAKEGDPEIPMSPYGVAKLASEKYIQTFASLFGLTYTIFRYSNVYGPRQDPHGEAGVVAIFTQKLLMGESPFIFGNGGQTRDFVFVGDVARANVLALHRGKNEIVNIGTGRLTSVLDLFRNMAQITGFKGRPMIKPARKGELDRSVLNNSYAKQVMGWTPQTSLKSGLVKTIEYFRGISQ